MPVVEKNLVGVASPRLAPAMALHIGGKKGEATPQPFLYAERRWGATACG